MNLSSRERNPLFLDALGRDTGEVRVALVERIDSPGALGVAMRGARFVMPLPDGYDAETSVMWHEGYVLVAHPNLPALQVDFAAHTINIVDPTHVQGTQGRMRLLTK